MPTAPKLVAALLFAAIAWLAAEACKPQLPEGMAVGLFAPIAAGVGLLSGWRVMGRLVGQGVWPSAGHGLRTSLTMLVWVLLIFGIREMYIGTTHMRYAGPIEAIVGIFTLAGKYALYTTAPAVAGVLVVGGMLAGALTELAARRWR